MAPVRLRVGILADARLQPRWMADAFANVARSGWAEVVALQASEGGASAGPWRLRIYRAMDRWAFGADLCDPVDLPAHVPYVFFTDCGRVSMLEIDAAGRCRRRDACLSATIGCRIPFSSSTRRRST